MHFIFINYYESLISILCEPISHVYRSWYLIRSNHSIKCKIKYIILNKYIILFWWFSLFLYYYLQNFASDKINIPDYTQYS